MEMEKQKAGVLPSHFSSYPSFRAEKIIFY